MLLSGYTVAIIHYHVEKMIITRLLIYQCLGMFLIAQLRAPTEKFWFGYDVSSDRPSVLSVRPSVRTLLRVSQFEMRHSNPVLQTRVFLGGKLRGQLPFRKTNEILKKAINSWTQIFRQTCKEEKGAEKENEHAYAGNE